MFSRLSQVARHLSRPLPNLAHSSSAAAANPAAARRTGVTSSSIMTTGTASADDRGARKIHTAACLIIGDEVLGGKVWTSV